MGQEQKLTDLDALGFELQHPKVSLYRSSDRQPPLRIGALSRELAARGISAGSDPCRSKPTSAPSSATSSTA